jgi:GxxExxY protein
MLLKEDLTGEILNCAFKVHTTLGLGMLESAYQICLEYELKKLGLLVESEVKVPIVYDEITLDCGYRIDLLVEKQVIIELKTVEKLTDIHVAQILTYMKFSNIKVGLLLNFRIKSLKDGIKRFIL